MTMGYEGRSVLLNDSEEWVNIPLVVREFMRQLNDEVHASRTVVEAMRQEQKEVHHLLRRIMQKQADLEIDSTRTALALSRSPPVASDATQKRQSEQIHYLRKKQEKLDAKMQLLEASMASSSQAQADAQKSAAQRELAERVDCLEAKAEALDKNVCDQLNTPANRLSLTQSLVDAAVAAAASALERGAKDEIQRVVSRVGVLEVASSTHQQALEAHKQENRKLRSLCGGLSDEIEKDRKVTGERLTACIQMVEKSESLCAAHKSDVASDVSRFERSVEASLATIREEATAGYAELRRISLSRHDEAASRWDELAKEVQAVKDAQRGLAQRLSDGESDSSATRALKVCKELGQRVGSLEDELEQCAASYATKRDLQKLQREFAEVLERLTPAIEEVKSAMQSQLNQAVQGMRTLQKEHTEDNDWLHNEVGRLGTVLSYATQQREKQERQVTSLCDIVHNLSLAVEALQARKVSSVKEEATAAPAARPAPAPASNDSAISDAGLPPSWEAWRSRLTKEVEAKLAAVTQAQQRSERVSQQLNELSAKVDGGAKYAQAMASQQAEQLRQAVKDEVGQQLQSSTALRDLTPALVDVEAVKRRLATLELEAQSSATRAERAQAEGPSGLGADRSDVLHRIALVEDSVDGFKRRLLDMGEQMMAMEQQHNTTARTVHQLETRQQDQARVAARLGTDLTAALESVLRTEESLAQHQHASAKECSELRTALEKVRQQAAALEALRDTESTPSADVASVRAALGRLGSDVAQLSSTVAALPDEMSDAFKTRLDSLRVDVDAVARESATTSAATAAVEAAVGELRETVVRGAQRVAGELAAQSESAARLQEDVQRHVAATAAALRDAVERLAVVERAAAAPPQPPTSSPHDPPVEESVSGAALRGCHERLDAHQEQLRRLSDITMPNALEGVRQELRSEMASLRDDLLAWAEERAAGRLHEVQSQLLQYVNAAVDAAHAPLTPAEEPTAATSLSPAELEGLWKAVEDRLSDAATAQQRELRKASQQAESLQISQAELRREVRDALAAQQERHEAVTVELRDALDAVRDDHDGARASGSEGDQRRGGSHELLKTIHADFYTKALLEERLENIWASMVSLLARKEDATAINEKLDGLHRLMQEEMQIEMEKLEDQLAGQLAEKVSLANLQDILEGQFADGPR